MSSFTLKIGGPAGLGVMSTGLIFSKVAVRAGYHIFDYTEYPSLIRGGHNVMEIHFSSDPVFAQEEKMDVLIAFNRETFDLHKNELKDKSLVIYDPDQVNIVSADLTEIKTTLLPVPFDKLLEKIGAIKLMENNIALGAACAVFSLPLSILADVIQNEFADKGEKIINANIQAATEGYNFVLSQKINFTSVEKTNTSSSKSSAVLTGNEAMGFGAIAGGCKFFSAYPMTPTSAVLHFLAQYGTQAGLVIRHAEDEIAAISEVIGASFAGVRSMAATSGGGFSLMVESISLAGITERGIVVILGQRPGPATGMPTWTEQGDLLFAIRAGHGEFPKIVLAPGDVYEAFSLTKKAFDLAEIYQTPVIVLSDKYLCESHQNVSIADLVNSSIKKESGKWETNIEATELKPYLRYKLSEDGISPRLIPGTANFYFQENSYEHLEDGHTSESAMVRQKQVEKRSKKISTYLTNHFAEPKLYGESDAEITLVGWGSMKLPVLEVLKNRAAELAGKKINFLHFSHLWPLDSEKIKAILNSCKRLVLIENNSTAQLGQLICEQTGIEIKEKILRYDGRPIYPSQIINYLTK